MRTRLGLLCAGIVALVGCDYSGDWLFAGTTDIEGILDLGEIEPIQAEDAGTFYDQVMYSEIGATGSAEKGGVTFSFEGNGSDICVWVDPELAFWSPSMSQLTPTEEWAYPDNTFDDGDFDLSVGMALYYTGTPADASEGGQIGDFEVRYEDSLGNKVPVDFNECVIVSKYGSVGGHSGRGTPEYCEIANTQPGVTYVVVMEAFATPLDDDRLSFALALFDGTCRDLKSTASSPSTADECILMGEAINPETPGEAWEGSEDFEAAFCLTEYGGDTKMALVDYCTAEATEKDCSVDHCFCGM